MASKFVSASTQYFVVPSTPVSAYPITFSGWFHFGNNGANQAIVNIAGFNRDTNHALRLAANSSNLVVANLISGGLNLPSITSAFTLNVWNHACGVFASASSRTAYLNGTAATPNTTSATPAFLDRIYIGANWNNTSAAAYANGRITDVGIWNVELTPGEISSLAKGISCRLVRPQSLVFYAPLIREFIDLKGRSLTPTNSPTVDTHSRIYY